MPAYTWEIKVKGYQETVQLGRAQNTLKQHVKDLNKALQSIKSTFSNSTSAYKQSANTLQGVSTKTSALTKHMRALSNAFKTANTSIDALIGSLAKIKDAVSSSTSALSAAKVITRETATSFKDLGRSARSSASGFDQVAKKSDRLQTSIKNIETAASKSADSLKRTADVLQSSVGSVSSAGTAFQTLSRATTTTARGMSKMSTASQKVKTSTAALKVTADQTNRSLGNTARIFNTTAQSARRVKSSMAGVGGAFKNARNSASRMSASSGKMATSMNLTQFAGEQMTGMLTRFSGTIGTNIAAFAPWGIAVAGAIAGFKALGKAIKAVHNNAMKIIAPFEVAEAELKALLGVAGASMNDIQQVIAEARHLGELPGQTASEALKTAIELARQGKNAASILQQLEPSMDAAAAGGIKASKAAKSGSVAYSIFAKSLRDAGKSYKDVLSIMTATVSASPLKDITQLEASYSQLGRTSETFGLSLTGTNAILAQFARVSKVGSAGGTALRGIFNELAGGSRSTKAALKKLEVSIEDSQGNIKAWPQLLGELSTAFEGVAGSAKRQELLVQLVKKRWASLLDILLKDGVAGFEAMKQSIENSSEAMDRLKAEKLKTMSFALKTAKSAWESLWLSVKAFLSTPISAFWNSVAASVTNVKNKIQGIANSIQTEMDKLTGEGKSPLDAWMTAVSHADYSVLFEGLAEALDPALQVLIKLWAIFLRLLAKMMRAAFGGGRIFREIGKMAIAVFIGLLRQIPGLVKDILVSAGGMIYDAITTPFVLASKFIKKLFKGKDKEITPSVSSPSADTSQPAPEPIPLDYEADVDAEQVLSFEEKLHQALGKRKQDLQEVIEKRAMELAQIKAAHSEAQALALAETEEGKAILEQHERKTRQEEAWKKQDRQRASEIQQEPGYSFDKAHQQAKQERIDTAKAEIETQALKTQKQQLDAQKALNAAKRKQHELTGQVVQEEVNLTLQLAKQETALKKYLLEPVDQFLQKIREIKDRFAKVFSGLRGQKVDLAEKFGLITPKTATQQRQETLTLDLQAAQEQLKLAQTASEKQAAYEQLGTLQGKYAETLSGRAQTTAARKGTDYLDKAYHFAQNARQLAIQKEEFDQQYAFTAIQQREGARGTFGTAQQELVNLQQLQAAYQQTGNVQGLQSLRADLDSLTIKASGEQMEILKHMFEQGKVSLELQKRQIVLMEKQGEQAMKQREQQLKAMQEMPIAPDPALQFA